MFAFLEAARGEDACLEIGNQGLLVALVNPFCPLRSFVAPQQKFATMTSL
jgi:hypothetical protein